MIIYFSPIKYVMFYNFFDDDSKEDDGVFRGFDTNYLEEIDPI
jgi:hypothetical protein